jgi:hypothetical protein
LCFGQLIFFGNDNDGKNLSEAEAETGRVRVLELVEAKAAEASRKEAERVTAADAGGDGRQRDTARGGARGAEPAFEQSERPVMPSSLMPTVPCEEDNPNPIIVSREFMDWAKDFVQTQDWALFTMDDLERIPTRHLQALSHACQLPYHLSISRNKLIRQLLHYKSTTPRRRSPSPRSRNRSRSPPRPRRGLSSPNWSDPATWN